MVIVLIFAAIFATFLGIWFKRRSDRKHRNDPTHRASALVAAEAQQSLRNKHPEAPASMSSIPQFDSQASLRPSSAVRSASVRGPPGSATRPRGVSGGARPPHRSASSSSATMAELKGKNRVESSTVSPVGSPGGPERGDLASLGSQRDLASRGTLSPPPPELAAGPPPSAGRPSSRRHTNSNSISSTTTSPPPAAAGAAAT